MTKREAKRIALYVTGQYLKLTDTTGLPEEYEQSLSFDDMERIQDAIGQIGREMIVRSGLEGSEIAAMVSDS